MTTRNCNQCGIEYQANRSTSKYCSDQCRVKAARVAKGDASARQRRFDEYHAIERTLLYNLRLWHTAMIKLREDNLADDITIDDKVFSIVGVVLQSVRQKPDTLTLRLSKRSDKYIMQKSML